MIDITNLTSLITAFRQETEQSSISPETLGSLLQKIADELGNASTDQEILQLTAIKENLQALGAFLYDIVQGPEDRNNILVNVTRFNPISGTKSAVSGQTFIKQATTARAGAMRAQHVDDLYTAKKNISALQTTAEEHQTSIDSINTHITEIDDYLEGLDTVVQDNSTNIDSLNSNLNSLTSKTAFVPVPRGNIVIDNTSLTSPATNYFNYSLPNGYYNILRSNQLIGRAIVSMMNGFKVVDIIGLCHISYNLFVYHDRIDHIILRIKPDGQFFVTGSIDKIDLQNQINELKDEVQTFESEDDFCSISGKCIRQGSLCTVIGTLYLDPSQKDVSAILPFKVADNYQPEYCTYYEDTMQWVKIRIYTDTNGTHIAASVPEDFMNDGEVSLDFSMSYLTSVSV